MSVYTRSNLTDNLWIVGEIWIPNEKKEQKNNFIAVSGFGLSVFNVKVIENKEKNKYQVVFYTLGKYKALIGECTYQDAYNEKLKSNEVPFIFGIYDSEYKEDDKKTQEFFKKLPEELKKLTNKYNEKCR
ncbi:hypothetical protein [Spiroplasma endosymbiont of Atherix ibis]|uniref:hypothetical protein n=1 Tax=Spiroplasma endosymbiont of Atherix ibis TaxID=3066291 RepID=UPI0030D3132D